MDTNNPHSWQYERIRSNPKFQYLVAQRAKLAWSLSAVTLVMYYTFMVAVIFTPDWLRQPLSEGSVLSRGIPCGAAIILVCWLLTVLYVLRANSHFDRINDDLVKEAQA